MSEPINLDEVLEEYAAATPAGNNLEKLRRVSEKYPQYADELADFAAARAVAKHAPDEEISPAEEKHFEAIGVSSLRKVLSELKTPAPESNLLVSLTDEAKAKGLSRAKFAAALGLSISLVQYLEKRRLDFASIPQAVIAKIAHALETAETRVADYLNQPPDYAGQASFKTTTRAEQSPPKSFADAVREDQQLTPAEKQNLLNFK